MQLERSLRFHAWFPPNVDRWGLASGKSTLTLSTRGAGRKDYVCGLQQRNLVDNHGRTEWLDAATFAVNVCTELLRKHRSQWSCSGKLREVVCVSVGAQNHTFEEDGISKGSEKPRATSICNVYRVYSKHMVAGGGVQSMV